MLGRSYFHPANAPPSCVVRRAVGVRLSRRPSSVRAAIAESLTDDYSTVYWDITRSVKEEFDRIGNSIPFPQRDVHVYHETVPEDNGHRKLETSRL